MFSVKFTLTIVFYPKSNTTTSTNFDENYEDHNNKPEPKTPLFSYDNNQIESQMDPEVTLETPDSEDVVAIQKTTRIPSGDEVETLLDELQEKDPKKRRQAIWGLLKKFLQNLCHF